MKYIITLLKIAISILLLFCLLKLPYGYYQFLRIVALVSFVFFSYQSYKQEDKIFSYIYASLAILFQPFIKIALGRKMWNIVDVVVGFGLLITIIWEYKNTYTQKKK
jgi:hypothetical protein